jgi:hypothetical protein
MPHLHFTKRKLIHCTHALRPGHCDSWVENVYKNHYGCQPKSYIWLRFWIMGNQNPLVDDQYDLYMHFLATLNQVNQVKYKQMTCLDIMIIA